MLSKRNYLPNTQLKTEVSPNLVQTKFLYLSSKYRDSGSINGFNVNLPSGFFKKATNQQVKLSLANITLTKSWYETRSGVSAEYSNSNGSFSIPDGSYTVDTIVDALNNDTDFNVDYTVSYNDNTNKLTFTSNVGTSELTPINCGYLLGLVDGTTYGAGGTSFTSVNPLNMTFEKTLYVNTNIATAGSSLDNINQTRLSYSTIIGTIPIPVGSYDIIQFTTNQFANSGLLLDNNVIDSLKVWISTERGNIPDIVEDFEISFKLEYFTS